MPLWLQIIVVACTLAGLGFAAFGIWVGYQKSVSQASAETRKLADLVFAQQDALAAAERRFQNLEAIVTSQAWDELHDDESTAAPNLERLTEAASTLEIPEEDLSANELVEQIARRVKT